jgi:DNA-binding MarR family transcriptional regulator
MRYNEWTSWPDEAPYGIESINSTNPTVYWVRNQDEVNAMHEVGLPAVCVDEPGPVSSATGRALAACGTKTVTFVYADEAPDPETLTRFGHGLTQNGIAMQTAVLGCGDLCEFYYATGSDPDELRHQISLLSPRSFTPLPLHLPELAADAPDPLGQVAPDVGSPSGTRLAPPVSPLIWACKLAPPTEGDEDTSLWAGIVYPHSIHLLSGESGCGKSTFFYNFAVRAAEGNDFLGFPFARPLRTLYIDLETPDLLRARKLARITDWPPPCGLAFRRETNLRHDLDTVIAEVREHRFDVVIVDTLSQAFDTQREDDNAEANRQMGDLRRLVDETGCALILIHHMGKASEGVGKKVYRGRGASARPAAADVVLNLEGAGDDLLKLEVAKNRWGDTRKGLQLRKLGDDGFEAVDGPPPLDAEASLVTQAQQRAIALLAAVPHGEQARQELVDTLEAEGFKEHTVKRALDHAIQTKCLQKRKDPEDGRRQLLFLPQATAPEVVAVD